MKNNGKQKQEIETLVDRILAAKQSDPAADVQPLETRIDHLVYHLYNLTPEGGAEGAQGHVFTIHSPS